MIRTAIRGSVVFLVLLFLAQVVVESYDRQCHTQAMIGRYDQLIAETTQADKEYSRYIEEMTK